MADISPFCRQQLWLALHSQGDTGHGKGGLGGGSGGGSVVAPLSLSRRRWRQRPLTRYFAMWVDQVMADMKRERRIVRNLWLKLGFE